VSAEPVQSTPEVDPLPPDRFLDREESWLRFNERVLALAEDTSVPLLERVGFLAIFAANLDEFFMVRVAGLHRRLATGVPMPAGAGGRTPRQVMAVISALSHELMARHAACFAAVRADLAEVGIVTVRWRDLTAAERGRLHEMFAAQVLPILTPLAVDPAHPFPYISGQSLSLAVVVRDPRRGEVPGDTVFARVKVPPVLPRFMEISAGRFVPIEDVIAAHLPDLFAGMEIVEHHTFRVTRNADLEVDEDETDDLLQSLEQELLRRRFGPAVRLEVEDTISDAVLQLIVRELGVEADEVYRVPGPLDLSGLSAIAALDRPELHYVPFVPEEPPALVDGDLFGALRDHELLVHHPYESFTISVERFLRQAATDDRVLAIKQTLYRTSGDSPIVDALISAAEAGKEVTVLVEVKARFDERANITWARKLEHAGCHVVYGLVGLKTHGKLALVVRREFDGSVRRYCHVGTGNYNPSTARVYEDFGLLSADPEVGQDLTDLFNHLTGYSRDDTYRRLLVAPHALREGLTARIRREIDAARAGRPCGIRIKVNSLVDEDVIDELYQASRAGVPVYLWVRGSCTLRPGVPGLSETIKVRSVLGRFLEHSRVYVFTAGGEPEVWLGSADLMPRNLDRRIEVLARIADADQRVRLVELLDQAMEDTVACWSLGPDGDWTALTHDDEGNPLTDLQHQLPRGRFLRSVHG
jgi:polyphosphate kinase